MHDVTRRTNLPLRVLLVEDSKVLAERLGELIREIDSVDLVGTVASQTAAVDCVNDQPVDVLVLDLQLKQGSGFGVMRDLAAGDHRPQIIVFTNYDLPEYQQSARALGATHFLDKARDFGRLPEVLRQIRK